MTNTNITDNRAKAIRKIADLLLHLSYIEHQLQNKFINGFMQNLYLLLMKTQKIIFLIQEKL